ncbi:MAG: preprotein translocase subunit SecE [Rhodoferax sp.]
MATPQVQTINTSADRAKLAGAVVLALAALAAYFSLSAKGSLVQWAVFLLGMAAAAALFLLSESGKQLIAFGRDAWREVRKVVWPTRKEATQITAYVFGFVLIMAMFLWLTDKSLEWLFYDLILGWKK